MLLSFSPFIYVYIYIYRDICIYILFLISLGCPGGGQNRSKGGPGEVQIGPRGALQRFQKTGRQKNTLPDQKIHLIWTKWGPKSTDF